MRIELGSKPGRPGSDIPSFLCHQRGSSFVCSNLRVPKYSSSPSSVIISIEANHRLSSLEFATHDLDSNLKTRRRLKRDMAPTGELNDGHDSDIAMSIPQTDGGRDSEDWTKRTPKKKTPKKGMRGTPKTGSGETSYTPRTPSRRGRRGGANAAATPIRSTRRSTVVGGINYEPVTSHVTTVEDTYTGPPAAAFTTLRREGSVRFKAKLQRLQDTSQQIVWSRHSSLESPQLSGPAQDLFAAGVPEESPVDSGIDVVTPSPDLALATIEYQQSTQQQVEDMAPVREISQAERDRLRERTQQSEAVSGKRSKSPGSGCLFHILVKPWYIIVLVWRY
jgi:hypothetical protein